MTRFARAKGSKASNERKEEDATPWHVMRQQLAEQLNNRLLPKDNSSSVKNEVLKIHNTGKSTEEVWSDFNESKVESGSKPKSSGKNLKIKKLKDYSSLNVSSQLITNEVKEANISKSNKKFLAAGNTQPEESEFKSDPEKEKRRNKKKEKSSLTKARLEIKNKLDLNKSKLLTELKSTEEHVQICKMEHENSDEGNSKESKSLKKSKRSKNNINLGGNDKIRKRKNLENLEAPTKAKKLVEFSVTSNKKSSKAPSTNILQSEKANTSDKNDLPMVEETAKSLKANDSFQKPKVYDNRRFDKSNVQTIVDSFQKPKVYDNRRFDKSNVQTIVANGRKIKIVKFEAFWIKEEDAIELRKLKKKLREQKVPNSKIKTVMKLERRKAEKALAREKTNVCYHCRQFGHNFSECPDIKESEMSKSGMCFKCGSLEHTHFQCKVTQNQDFRYAVCFVCKEQGHIARQCTLNPKGQYPKGGSCHLCGEITHLRKDCPKAIQENPSGSFTVENINNNTQLEDLGPNILKKEKKVKPQNKMVKF